MKLGINPSVVRYWTNQLAFKDIRKSADFYKTAVGNTPTGGFYIPGDPKTDASGNPTSYIVSAEGGPTELEMPIGTVANVLMVRDLTNLPNPYPSGIYHILFDGSGTIDLNYDPEWPSSSGLVAPGDVSFTVNNPTTAGILLSISSAPTDGIRNVRVVHDDDLSTYETQPFSQKFLDNLTDLSHRDGGYFRAMNWQYSNYDGGRWTAANDRQLRWREANSSWDDRVITAMPQGEIGCSLEYAVQICNTIGRNLWYNVAHVATPEFITSAATYIKDNLNPHLSTVVEWSNEFWNGGFYQSYYAYLGAASATVSAQYYGGLTQSSAVPGTDPVQYVTVPARPGGGGTGADSRAGKRFGADRTREACDIFYSVFGESAPTRVHRTIGTQSANSWQGERMLEWSGVNSEGPPVSSLDSVSIAPYFGGVFGRNPLASEILNGPSSVAQILASATYTVTAADGRIRTDVQGHKTLANYYDLDLYCYEGGQHFVGVGGALENSMFPIFSACNDDPGMGVLYTDYMNMLEEEGVDLFCVYRSIGKYVKQTMFGAQQGYGYTTRPKYDAIVAFIGATAVSKFFENNLGYRLNINS